VEQEAASSLELRQLALNEGRKTEAYEQARSEWVVKRDKIIKKFGKESEAYIRLTDAAKAALQAVGIREGAKSQVYKDALKAATERLKAATAETDNSVQKPRTKRTEQVVRKSTVEPSTMRTGSTESKEGATTTKVKRGATSADINPKRKPFVATEETPETEPPVQETTPRSATDKRAAPTVDPKAPRKPKKGERPVEPATTASRDETPEETKARLEAVADAAKKVLVKENARLATFRKELADLEAELKDSEAKLAEEERQGRGTPSRELVREYQSRIANQKAAVETQLRTVTEASATYVNAVSASLAPVKPAEVETKPAETKPAETKPAAKKPAEVEAKPAETKATTTPEQKQAVEDFVARNDLRRVYWHEGDLIVFSTFNKAKSLVLKAGKLKGNLVTQSDFSNFDSSFSTEDQNKLLQAKAKIEAAESQKHVDSPYIKWNKDGLAFSQSVPENIASVVTEWRSLLGIRANIYFTTYEDLEANKGEFTGPHQEIPGFLVGPSAGAMRKLHDGTYAVVYTKGGSIVKTLEILAHEMGHVHMKNEFDSAPKDVQDAIKDAHAKCAASLEKASGR
jgi:hypothetical protein